MTDKKDAPAATNSQGDNTINHPAIVSNNPNPRQRWRGNPPRKRIPMSDELMTDFAAMVKKWGAFREY